MVYFREYCEIVIAAIDDGGWNRFNLSFESSTLPNVFGIYDLVGIQEKTGRVSAKFNLTKRR